MQLLANIFVFMTFFMIPFLGDNHLPLYYISIDRFWIEGIFGLLLVFATTLSFLKDKTVPIRLFQILCFLSTILCSYHCQPIIFLEPL